MPKKNQPNKKDKKDKKSTISMPSRGKMTMKKKPVKRANGTTANIGNITNTLNSSMNAVDFANNNSSTQVVTQRNEREEKGYLYCMKTFDSKDQIVYKLGKTKNLTERLKSYRTGFPGANFEPCCPPCRNSEEKYDPGFDLTCTNPPSTYLIDYHLAEKVLHIFLKAYRCGSTECFNLNESDIKERIPKLFEKIKKMSKAQLQNVIDNRETFELVSSLEKQLAEERERNKLLQQRLAEFTDEKIDELVKQRMINQLSVSAKFDEIEDSPNIRFEEFKGQEDPVFEDQPREIVGEEEYWDDDPSDDEDFEELEDPVQSLVASIRKAITLNISLDETDILYDFDILETKKKFELLKFLNVDGLLCKTTKSQLKQKLIDWFNEEKDIKVKIHIPFKFRPKHKPKSVENYSKQLCKKFDSKFYKEIYDEKNSEFHDNLHDYLEDIYIHTFHDDSNIDGYLTIKIYVNRNDQPSEYIPRLKNIAQWIIDQANSSKVFTGTFECDLENCIVLFRTSSGIREYEKL